MRALPFDHLLQLRLQLRGEYHDSALARREPGAHHLHHLLAMRLMTRVSRVRRSHRNAGECAKDVAESEEAKRRHQKRPVAVSPWLARPCLWFRECLPHTAKDEVFCVFA